MLKCLRVGDGGGRTTSVLARLDDHRSGCWQFLMVAEEAETGRVACTTQIDDHHAIFSMVDAGFEVGAHEIQLTVGQVADEDGVLNANSIAFHTDGYRAQPFFVADIVCGQVAAASHYLVTKGSYAVNSLVR